MAFQRQVPTEGDADARGRSDSTKHVQWGAVSILEFRVGYNASAVPESGGPPVGLVGRPTGHSCSMLLGDEDAVVKGDLEVEQRVDTDVEIAVTVPRSLSCSGRRCHELWLGPMERARLLAENQAFDLDDIALICRDVRATLDARARSRWDDVTTKTRKDARVARQDVSVLWCGGGVYSSARKKMLLY